MVRGQNICEVYWIHFTGCVIYVWCPPMPIYVSCNLYQSGLYYPLKVYVMPY